MNMNDNKRNLTQSFCSSNPLNFLSKSLLVFQHPTGTTFTFVITYVPTAAFAASACALNVNVSFPVAVNVPFNKLHGDPTPSKLPPPDASVTDVAGLAPTVKLYGLPAVPPVTPSAT
jgi:hypothetical protein